MLTGHVNFVALVLYGILALSINKPITAIELTSRPPYNDYAKMARYLVHKSNWTSMGTISSLSTIHGFPMVNVISIADSANGAPSTGRIYLLLTDLDFTGQDLAHNNKLTAMFTEDQDLACTLNNTDTMEPTCGRVIFTGKIQRLTPGTQQYNEAEAFYTDRHPASLHWRKTHSFYFCTLNIEHIAVLDFYGGAHYVSIDDYYNANYDAEGRIKDIKTIEPSVIVPKQL
ncbi:protein CREG1-like [Contarinia nasturtii]|uniref:protein CREG1-like n=1 Tax=Contarinia nasturtii TaxID=265458 RepID=UPI0012D4A3D7|nr:protein CREG1-like [Contarinia nasturtii]